MNWRHVLYDIRTWSYLSHKYITAIGTNLPADIFCHHQYCWFTLKEVSFSKMSYELCDSIMVVMGPHFHSISPAHWHHTEAQQTQPLNEHMGFIRSTWGLVEAGGSVGGCSFITVVTMEEPKPKTVAMGEGCSVGGVTLREGEAAKEDGGSSNTSLSFRTELSSGSGRKPGQRQRWGRRGEEGLQYNCTEDLDLGPEDKSQEYLLLSKFITKSDHCFICYTLYTVYH